MVEAEMVSGWLRRSWFLPLFAVLLAVEIAFASATARGADGVAEAAILFDLCLFVPAVDVEFRCARP